MALRVEELRRLQMGGQVLVLDVHACDAGGAGQALVVQPGIDVVELPPEGAVEVRQLEADRRRDGLEQAGLVGRASCESDRRVTYAVLTEAGRAKLREASETHIADIRQFFESRFSPEEIDQLVDLLGRLPGAADAVGEACGTD